MLDENERQNSIRREDDEGKRSRLLHYTVLVLQFKTTMELLDLLDLLDLFFLYLTLNSKRNHFVTI